MDAKSQCPHSEWRPPSKHFWVRLSSKGGEFMATKQGGVSSSGKLSINLSESKQVEREREREEQQCQLVAKHHVDKRSYPQQRQLLVTTQNPCATWPSPPKSHDSIIDFFVYFMHFSFNYGQSHSMTQQFLNLQWSSEKCEILNKTMGLEQYAHLS